MAVYSKGTNGAFSGKAGSIVGSNWRGVDYLKSMPKKSNKKGSELQLAQRRKFALAPLYLSPIKDILNIGFKDKQLNKTTGYNAAVKIFLNNAIVGDYPDFAIDFSQIVLSKGSLSEFHGLSAALQGINLVLIWQCITNRYDAFDDDMLMVVLFNDTKKMHLVYEAAQRAALTYTAIVGNTFAGDVFYGWAFAVKRENNVVSNSQYLGSFTMPQA
ncbi:DUF6266 family protein [Pedobacter alluvionis]|uniref:Coat protein n=1 Tax=Pedobacter alluvionis TaxID=475253 RepID=A0A497XVB8_9SPHI|nr:DUF6266 family protein [Pedobacter alluvionis]RLJ73695.1 hypothetical protein BCL90_3858 [Pedobacter alluvionis]TFB32681.1 hypothetical protein E3V97_01195 [Pedobacter alluvionis]